MIEITKLKANWLKRLFEDEIKNYELLKQELSSPLKTELDVHLEQHKDTYICFLRLLRDIELSDYTLIKTKELETREE